MTIDPDTLLAIAAMALATVLTRLAGLVLIRYVVLDGAARTAIGKGDKRCWQTTRDANLRAGCGRSHP